MKKNVIIKKMTFSRLMMKSKNSIHSLLKKINIYISKNIFFCFFVLINLINSVILRVLTIGGIDTLFAFSPFIADLSFLIIMGSFGYLMKEKKQVIYYVILSFILMLLCTINSSYYTFYTSFASVSFLSTTKFIFAVGDAVVENVIKLRDVIYIILFILLVALFCKFKKENTNKSANKKLAFKTMLVGLITSLVFCLTLTQTAINGLFNQWNREYIVSRYGIYVYHINDFVKSIGPKISSVLGYDEAIKTFNDFYNNRDNKTEPNDYTGVFEGKNIIGIHGESVQNFLIGLKINGKEVTPNLNKLVKKSLYFDNFYSQVSVGTSSDTEFTLATSLMPSNNGTVFGNYYDRTYIAMPGLLKEKGYYTFAMHGNTADYWNRRVMHKNLGYEYFYAKDSFDIDETIGLGLSDSSFFRQGVEKLKLINNTHEKWYGTFITLTNHTPFSEISKYGDFDVTMTVDGVKYDYMEGTKLGNYFKSVHYADKALGEFFDALEKNKLLENTVIVFYGDHDARLPIEDYLRFYNYDIKSNDVLNETNEKYITFDNYSYELNRKVPLIIYSKDIEPRKISTVMGMYDVMPTLGNMFSFSNKYALGHDIFDIKDDNIVVFPTGNWVTNKVYYNTQKQEYLVLRGSIIDKEYIMKNDRYANDVLSVSNAIVMYDLIKNTTENKVDESKVIGGN